MLYHQGLPYIPEIIRTKLISRHHNDPLAGRFGFEKTRELVARKYYWPTLCHDVKEYDKGSNICLAFKEVRHKPTGLWESAVAAGTNSLLERPGDGFCDGSPIPTDWGGNFYNSILVTVDPLKMVYYEPVQVTTTSPALAEAILDIAVRHHGFPNLMISNRSSVFTSKFWSSLSYF